MKTIDELETPAVVVDLDVMERNLARMADYARTYRLCLRPHTKTHKIPEFARAQLASGARGVTVAKTGEAEVMAAAGIDDLLIAYPVYGAAKWERLARLAREKTITVAIDSLVCAQGLSEAVARQGVRFGVLLELDVGMRRCGVSTPQELRDLAYSVSRLSNLAFRGILFYPGHIWNPPEKQEPELAKVSAKVEEAVDLLAQAGLPAGVISGGSTPTAWRSHLVSQLTEIRPGTYIFNDRNTVGVGACREQDCALRVLLTVVSVSVPGRAILDGGSKTLAADGWRSGSKGYGLIVEHPDAVIEALSEEHAHVDIQNSSWRPKVGERVTVIPNHVCACVNLHESLICHRQGRIEEQIPVAARGRIC